MVPIGSSLISFPLYISWYNIYFATQIGLLIISGLPVAELIYICCNISVRANILQMSVYMVANPSYIPIYIVPGISLLTAMRTSII